MTNINRHIHRQKKKKVVLEDMEQKSIKRMNRENRMIIKIRNGQNRLTIKRMLGQSPMSIKRVTRAQRKIFGQSHMNLKRINLEDMKQKSMIAPNRRNIKRVIMIQRRINIRSPKIPKIQSVQSRTMIKKKDGLCGKHWIEQLSFHHFLFCSNKDSQNKKKNN